MKIENLKLTLLLPLIIFVTSCASNQPPLQAVACPAMTPWAPPESAATQPYLDQLKKNQQSSTGRHTSGQQKT